MAATKFTVNYSKATGRIRSFVVFNGANEDDSNLADVRIAQGEAQAVWAIDQLADLHTMQAALNKITGLTPTNDRHAIVDASGNVVGVVYADPAGCGDAIAGHGLIASTKGAPGDFTVSGVICRKFAQIDSTGTVTALVTAAVDGPLPAATNNPGTVIAAGALKLGNVVPGLSTTLTASP